MSKRFLLSACAALTTCLLTAGAAAAGTARAAWPSLQSQLAQDRVPAGSPLAKLIASNQDFQLLRPEEAYDRIAAPPWLRVLWRKEHPDMQYVPGDRSGGYPLVLKEVYEWMVAHPDLQPGSLGRDVTEEKKKPAARGPKPVPGPDFSISGAQVSPRSESDIRVNFWDPSRIVGASNNLIGGGSLAIFYSGDGGSTWKHTVLPRDVSESFQSDPAVDWTSDGTVWATNISVYASPFRLYLKAYKSTDSGATWKLDTTISSPDQSSADKQMMWTDHSEQSPFKDNIYVIWHDGREVYVSHHTPGGGWSDPLRISGGETLGTGIGSDIKTDALGHVYAFWPDTGSRRIFFAKSTDGGQSFSAPKMVSPTFQSFQTYLPAQSSRGVLLYTTAAVQLNGKSTNLYVAWTDLSGAKGCNVPVVEDPENNVNSNCKTRIWFSRSVDGGTKWTKAKAINNPSSKNDQLNPWLTIDESTGLLGLMYYDSVGGPRTSVNVFFQSSANGGTAWSTPVRISSASSNDEDFFDPNQFGDYNSLSAAAGTFFPSWTDRRDPDGKEEIWTAPITIQAKSCQGVGSSSQGVKIFIDGIEDLFANSCAP